MRAKRAPEPLATPRGWPALRPGLKVGLLGGSFNPAHDGHVHLSQIALQRLGLDQVWWLVSPQNPLKPTIGMTPLDQRLEGAKTMARDPRIWATDLEAALGTEYSIDTVKCLKRLFPKVKFVWLMGADNLIQIPQWRQWTTLFEQLPIAIMGRPTYSLGALNGLAAQRYRRRRVLPGKFRSLASRRTPAWAFIPGPLHLGSATAIRKARKLKSLEE